MTPERADGPWPGATYNGFAGGEPAVRPYRPPPQPPRAAPPRGQDRRLLMWGGIAAALVGGVLLGVITRPELGLNRTPAEPMKAVTPVPVEVVAPPATVPAAPATEPLEVMSPELKAAAAAQPARVPPPRPAAPQAAAVAPIHSPIPAPASPSQVAPPVGVAEASPPSANPSFDCDYARTRSERMVCSDEGLARLDRRLSRAFDRALASGVPFRALRAEQDDWLAIREDAARQAGRDGVASVYRQRIRELNAIADDG